MADCDNSKEAKGKNLFCATGFGRAFHLYVEMFIRCAAARPRTVAGAINEQSSPIYKRFNERNRLFQLGFFRSPQFRQVLWF